MEKERKIVFLERRTVTEPTPAQRRMEWEAWKTWNPDRLLNGIVEPERELTLPPSEWYQTRNRMLAEQEAEARRRREVIIENVCGILWLVMLMGLYAFGIIFIGE